MILSNRHSLVLMLGMAASLLLTTGCQSSVPGASLGPGSTTTTGGTSGNTTGGSTGTSSGGSSTPVAVTATVLEQLTLERVNRTRLKPGEEAANAGIAIDEGIPGQLIATPRQPVAMNATLRSAAYGHSQDMLDRNYFAHDTPEGVDPFTRIGNEGYLYISAGENLAWRGTTGILDDVSTVETQHTDLFVDAGIDGRGHRVTMLNTSFREVGIAIIRGAFTRDGLVYGDSIMQTQDYGCSPSGNTFVLGVVYEDANGNGQYDAGEGSGGVTVQFGPATKATNIAGGYEFEVKEPGTYTLRFASGHSRTFTIEHGDLNLKVDLRDRRDVIVNLGLGEL